MPGMCVCVCAYVFVDDMTIKGVCMHENGNEAVINGAYFSFETHTRVFGETEAGRVNCLLHTSKAGYQ